MICFKINPLGGASGGKVPSINSTSQSKLGPYFGSLEPVNRMAIPVSEPLQLQTNFFPLLLYFAATIFDPLKLNCRCTFDQLDCNRFLQSKFRPKILFSNVRNPIRSELTKTLVDRVLILSVLNMDSYG